MQPEITRKISFEPIEFKYDRIKDEIARMKHAEYITAIGQDVINEDDI